VALTAVQALKTADALYGRLKNRRPEISKFENYADGKHPLRLGSEEWSQDHATRFKGWSDNWCGVVASAPGERTALDGFRVGDDDETESDEEKELWRQWDLNEMPSQASQGFLTSRVARRSSVLVWGDEDENPVVTWEHPSQVIVDYDPSTRQSRYALKAWLDDDRELATLYTADEVWKFERSRIASQVVNGVSASGLLIVSTTNDLAPGGWKQRQFTGDDTWPITNPLGILPVQEVLNRPQLGGKPVSDIEGTVSMQDAINMLWKYLFAAADYASMPARVVMGLEPPKMPILDENGVKIGDKPVDIESLQKGRMLWLTGQGGSIGQWDAAKLDVFTAVINVAVKHLAAQTKTPIHYIVGELGNVNGETLTATETPLAMKVREAHEFHTPAIRGVFRRIALVQGKKDLADACRTGQVQWRNPEIRSEAQMADAASKDKATGFPLMWIAKYRFGYTQKQLAELEVMLEKERTDPVLQAALKSVVTPPAPGSTPPAQPGVPGAQVR
jgi:hypothetical protein